ncbi:MAG: hypothetical protein JXQ74_03065, partial [Alphaproteobacteria bacterium]|nr:hypothetical protein [Alphaproteobacteria bacterium]
MARIYKKAGFGAWMGAGFVGFVKFIVYFLLLLPLIFKGKTGVYKGFVKAVKQASLFLSLFSLKSNLYK